MERSNLIPFAFLAAILSAPMLGHAQSATEDTGRGPSHVFGRSGQIAFSSDAALSVAHITPADQTTLTLAPAADFFVADSFSIGGVISLNYVKAGDSDTVIFGIGPRLGYNLTLSDLVSLWPKIGVSYAHSEVSNTTALPGGAELDQGVSNDALALNLFVPFMFHPAQHFFAGFGPFLDTDLSGDNKNTTFGLKLTLGGWVQT